MLDKPVHARILVGADWLGANDVIEIRNPANPDEIVGIVPRGTADHVGQAVAAAKSAQSSWGALTFGKRASILDVALNELSQKVEERARLYARENGRVLAEAIGELRAIPVAQRLTLGLAAELDAGRQLPAATGRTFVDYILYGVVVSIVPWNAPVTLAFLQVIPALLGGNAVVVKPPESCPLALIDILGAVAAQLPAGLVNVVTGRPEEIGTALTTHPDVTKIGFTGSIPSARRIMANAAQSIKGVTLELGGNDPAILLDDVVLDDDALKRMAHGVFAASGQVCMAIKRIYVPEERAAEFSDAFAEVVSRYVVGDGLKAGVSMGPMHTRNGRDAALALIDELKRRGATVRQFGTIDDEKIFQKGFFVRPAVVTNIPDDAPLMRDEQFCPAIPVTTYRTIDEAVERANNTHFGLCASIWGTQIDQTLDVARQMQAGTVFINSHGVTSVNRRAPYGGVKQSGIGRKASIEGMMEYVQLRTITTCGEAV